MKVVLQFLDEFFRIAEFRGYAQELGWQRTAVVMSCLLAWLTAGIWSMVTLSWPNYCEPQGRGIIAAGHVGECLAYLTHGGVSEWTFLLWLTVPLGIAAGAIGYRILWELRRRRN